MSKAKLLFDEANQKIQRLNLFTTRIFGNSEDLKEQIVDLLYRSFDQYNICKDYENSIVCLEKIMKYAKNDDLSKYAQDAIKIYIKLKDFDKIESLIETYFPPDRITGQTIKILSTLIKEFIDIDEFNKAEKYLLMGQQYAEYLGSTTNILEYKNIHAHLYLKSDPPKYKEASELFMQLGREYLDNKLLSSYAIDVFTKAIIIQLVREDIVKAEEYFNLATNYDFKYMNSREGKFANNILNCVKKSNESEFMQFVEEYDNGKSIEPVIISLLLAIKNKFNTIL